jgi:hypothetical protein
MLNKRASTTLRVRSKSAGDPRVRRRWFWLTPAAAGPSRSVHAAGTEAVPPSGRASISCSPLRRRMCPSTPSVRPSRACFSRMMRTLGGSCCAWVVCQVFLVLRVVQDAAGMPLAGLRPAVGQGIFDEEPLERDRRPGASRSPCGAAARTYVFCSVLLR